jgi:hypothetical protein
LQDGGNHQFASARALKRVAGISLRVAIFAAPVALFVGIIVFLTRNDVQIERSVAAIPAANSLASVSSGDRQPPPDPQISLLGTDSSLSPKALELVLVATRPGKSPGEGDASLGTDVRNPQTYAAGARLGNGAILKEIYPDYVVLSLERKLSILALQGRTPKVREKHQSLPTDEAATHVGGEAVVNAPIERVPSSREDLSEIIRSEPHYERDEFAGLKIVPGTNRGQLARLELQAGDIVRTIDGKRLKSPDTAWQTLDDAISTGTPIVISIEREGTLMSISLDGSKLSEPAMQLNSFAPPPNY